MAFTNRVYRNPYSFLVFLKRNKIRLITYLIFKVQHGRLYPMSQRRKHAAVIFRNLFLLKIALSQNKNHFSYIQKPEKKQKFVTEQIFLKKTLDILSKTRIPNIIITKLEVLKEFYIQHKDMKECYEYYFEKYIMHDRRNFILRMKIIARI